MTKFTGAVAAAIAVVLGILGFSGAAEAYPDAEHSLTVDQQVVFGGDSFTAFASANVDCAWTLEWNGQARQGSGAEFQTTYVAPQVTATEKLDLVGTCAYADPASGTAKAAAASWQNTITITVQPGASAVAVPGDDDSTSLPGTGGPNFAVLLSGVLLLLFGAIAVAVARHSADEAEIPAPTA